MTCGDTVISQLLSGCQSGGQGEVHLQQGGAGQGGAEVGEGGAEGGHNCFNLLRLSYHSSPDLYNGSVPPKTV